MSGKQKRGLGGKGLRALINTVSDGPLMTEEKTNPSTAQSSIEKDQTLRVSPLPIECIQRGKYQPRRDMEPEALEELAESIRRQGLIQPIVVRPVDSERWEIIAGERRWRAAQLAGMESIPAMIKDISDEAAIAMALIENIQREDLNPIEEALSYKRLQDEFDLTQQEVAEAVGKSRSTVANLMRLLGLDAEVRILLEHGDIEMGHARALLALPIDQQCSAANTVVSRSLSVRQTESLVRRLIERTDSKIDSPVQYKDNDTIRLEESLSERLGAKVEIDHGTRGNGKLVIQYTSLEELDGILAHIR